ncbi:alpha-beta hydrolase superfamily lysophospholipase [Entomoplasma freundtii]|uniref:Lysophospholipase n=1 Tax=Entomoplasma freundtii TaxID=74700 RepID=A0A2K8NQV2_9MOLU|nr:alpha/beta fold hydrolase [Entomoplasma freundtii]ATZ16199.1 lysophospholipase [Entomoplasma freundtii]TDY56900.1 alpha-beta hydrolase superfamily lysophospholipase [Entomoplasma freundtii]
MREFNLRMLDGKELHCYEWTAVTKPQAVLQLVHGSAEHLRRYDKFAKHMNENGIIVVGDDHRGHGYTADLSKKELGYFANHHGWEKIVDDEKLVNDYIHKTWPTLPVFMLGHSMGSFMVRTYAIKYSKTIQGLIIMGTAENPRFLVDLGYFVALMHQIFKGAKTPDVSIWKQSYKPLNKKFRHLPDSNGQEWLTRDLEVQKAFAKDPLTKQVFTTSAFKDMFYGISYNQKKRNIKLMREDLPILIMSGTDDPVGNYGKYPQKVYNKFSKLNYPVEIKLYPDSRHEILNDLDYKEVEKDIVNFINQNLE